MPAIEESLRNIVGRQETSFQKVLDETAAIKAMLERVLQTQEEQALQEFTVTTTVRPTNRAAVVIVTKTPPLRASPTAASQLPTAIPLGGSCTTPPTPLITLVRKSNAPAYTLNRDIQTVPALWKLWTVGIGGTPSVEELDRQYGAGWRQTSSERQYYSMRKTLIDEIKERVAKAGDGDSKRIVRDMEARRLSTKPPMSLDKVIKTLKAARKVRDA